MNRWPTGASSRWIRLRLAVRPRARPATKAPTTTGEIRDVSELGERECERQGDGDEVPAEPSAVRPAANRWGAIQSPTRPPIVRNATAPSRMSATLMNRHRPLGDPRTTTVITISP